MQLSILIGTNRTGLLACSRIAQACSWASPDIEVIVRDNSGNAQKREFLTLCRRDHCNVIFAEPSDALTNFSETLRLAKGDFVFVLADDDFCFDRAIPDLANLIERFGNDPSVCGVTGSYVVEKSDGSSVLSYQNIEADDATARVVGFLSYVGPNVLHYAPIRREVAQRVFAFMNALPCFFSFHDLVFCMLYLLNGKFVRLNRLIYAYEIGVWENPITAQNRDLEYYRNAGFDLSINMLHWFLCGFEGAVLIRNANVFPDLPLQQRQIIADTWFSHMYVRFKFGGRPTFDSKFAAEAETVRGKLLTLAGSLSFQDLLIEIASFMALSSTDKARSYFDFWDAVINKRALPPRRADTPAVLQKAVGSDIL